MHPEEMLLRSIGEIWAKKIAEDAQMDLRGKPRVGMKKFVNDHFLRQYGVRGVAQKAFRDFVLSLRHYISTGSAAKLKRKAVILATAGAGVFEPWREPKPGAGRRGG